MSESVRITIILNGKETEVPENISVDKLIDFLKLDRRTIAVGKNHDVVRRSIYSEAMVLSGDRIDIVNFVAGG